MSQITEFYLDYLFKGLQVFLHTVVRTQKGDKIARIHSIETMEKSINAGMEMDKINLCHVTWKKQLKSLFIMREKGTKTSKNSDAYTFEMITGASLSETKRCLLKV